MPENKQEILIATKNAGKIKEIEELLATLPVRLRGLRDFPNAIEPEETGKTFIENAILKARSYALQTGLSALADDSGLEVEALNGTPGIFSARYAGKNAADNEKIEKLLKEMAGTQSENRRARFVCAMAVADKTGKIKLIEEGTCDGKIISTARGKNGFGYDPVFVPDGFTLTFGELPEGIKREISHRARALNKIIQQIRRFYASLG